MRIGWVGISVSARTGYGKVTADILSRLKGSSHHAFISVAQSPDMVVWGGRQEMLLPDGRRHITTLPISDPMSKQSETVGAIQSYARKFKLDMLLGFWDAFAIEWLPKVGMPCAAYIPVDGKLTGPWMDYVKDNMNVVVYSKFGWSEFASSPFPISKLSRIDHGVDTKMFFPVSKASKKRARRMVDASPPIPEDCFLLVSVAANYGDRKKIPLLFETFARFARKHEDAHLYFSTNPYAKFTGYNLPVLVDMLGLNGRVHFPAFNPLILAAPDRVLRLAYQAADAYVTASCAEGFGVPLLEAAACGVPAIAPRNSSQEELVEGHGWLAENVPEDSYSDWPMYVPQLTKYPVCDQRSLLEQMESAYGDRKHRQELGIKARRFSLGYDWSRIVPQWLRLFDSLESEIELSRSVL